MAKRVAADLVSFACDPLDHWPARFGAAPEREERGPCTRGVEQIKDQGCGAFSGAIVVGQAQRLTLCASARQGTRTKPAG
jgi:hypothetical protein